MHLIYCKLIFMLIFVFCDGGIVINEINSDDPSKPEKNEFIEIVAFGKKRPFDKETTLLDDFSLRGYKILVLSAFHKGANGPTIELVANLWNSRIHDSYFVLGGASVPNADLKTDSPLVAYRKKFTQSRGLFAFIGNANRYPNAVIVVQKSDGLPEIKLSRETPFLKITPEIKDLIRSNLVDMVVYGRRAAAEQCSIFEDLYPNFVDRQYILREFDIPDRLEVDYSLNRCTFETTSFLPEKFKLGKKTPKAENDCTGAHFIITRAILSIAGRVDKNFRSDPADDNNNNIEMTNEPICSSTIGNSEYYGVVSSKVHQYIQTKIDMSKMNEICRQGSEGDITETGNNDGPINSADRASSILDVSPTEREWETKKHFKLCLFNSMKLRFP